MPFVFLTTSQFEANMAQCIPGAGNSSLCQKGLRLFPRGDNYDIAKIHWRNLKYLLLNNNWAKFIHTWHKASLGDEDSSLFQKMALPFFQGEKIKKWRKYIDEIKKKSSSQEPPGQFQPNMAQSILRW